MKLPIDILLPEVVRALEKHPNLIIEASPGSGKTTRVSPALLKAPFRGVDQEIWILEPRRLAAKYSAHRIATELGTEIGEEVGYQFRFENVTSSKTRLRFVTEGMFLRLLIQNPRLERVAAVILDEFHERHIQSDVALGYLKWLQGRHRTDLRILLMSATLEADPLARYLQDAPVLRLQAPLHPVAIQYLPAPAAKPIDQLVRETAFQALRETSGDLLVFLPGMSEMRRCEQALVHCTDARIFLLHGELSREEQDQALRPGGGRKIILSTNVAETSLTLPGVTAVIDSGLHRMASYSWWSGIPALKTRPISRASAVQRAGRAGRTGPGTCYRLYTQGDFETRAGFEKPELMRSDLSQTLLELKALGVTVGQFPWFEAPPPPSLQAGEELLYRLGAAEHEGKLTEIGRSMSRIPTHPRISRMLLEAKRLGVLEPATWLGAALSEGKIERSNPLEGLVAYSQDESLRKAQRLLLQALGGVNPQKIRGKLASEDFSAISRAVLKGFPDRVAQKRKLGTSVARSKAHEVELLLASGGSAMLEETPAMTGQEFFILLDLQEQQAQNQRKSNLHVRSWIPIEEDWLLEVQPMGIEEHDACVWDVERKKVLTTSRLTYGELVLSESSSVSGPAREVTDLLIKRGLGLDPGTASTADWIRALTPLCDSSQADEVEAAFARAKFYLESTGAAMGDSGTQLSPLFEGKSSLAELKQIDWPTEILNALVGEAAHRLRELLPANIVLPSGRRAKIHYTLSQPPWVESRLQDFFGMKKAPLLLNGRLALSIHLLAPNHRPVQVTTDLESFWKNHYPQLRPALSRRYPRHSWPEDPS